MDTLVTSGTYLVVPKSTDFWNKFFITLIIFKSQKNIACNKENKILWHFLWFYFLLFSLIIFCFKSRSHMVRKKIFSKAKIRIIILIMTFDFHLEPICPPRRDGRFYKCNNLKNKDLSAIPEDWWARRGGGNHFFWDSTLSNLCFLSYFHLKKRPSRRGGTLVTSEKVLEHSCD